MKCLEALNIEKNCSILWVTQNTGLQAESPAGVRPGGELLLLLQASHFLLQEYHLLLQDPPLLFPLKPSSSPDSLKRLNTKLSSVICSFFIFHLKELVIQWFNHCTLTCREGHLCPPRGHLGTPRGHLGTLKGHMGTPIWRTCALRPW